jgi:PAS domain S-box-containing protein
MESFHQHKAFERPDTVEDRLRLVIDTIPCLILRAKPDGAFDFINRRWLEFTGLKPEEVQGWGWRTALHPEDAGRVVRDWRAALAEGEPFETEARIRRVDGEYHWFLLRNVPLRDEEGRIVQWYGTGHDTDDLKRAADRLRLAIDTTPALIHTGRPDGYLDYFNQRWLEYLGLSLEDISGWRWTNVIHPDDVEEMVKKWRSSLATGEPFEAEARVRRADGEYRWQFHRKVPLREQSGQIAKWFGSSIDIQDRRRAEDALRRSESYLAEGQRLGHTGSWALSPRGFFEYWSDELFRIYGFEPPKGAPTLEEYLASIYPPDREFMALTIERMLAEHSGCDIKKRIVRPNGEVRYVRCVGGPVFNNGFFTKIVGTAMDVTEEERLTEELRRREAYLAEAQRLSQTGSFGWRPECGEIVWSDETHRIFEYDHAVKPTMDLLVQRVHPEDRPDFLKVIESASAGATQFEHTYRWLLPDGRVKHVHALAHALQDASGNREFVGAATDITEQTRARADLEKAFEEIKKLKDQLYRENIALREEIDKTSMFEEIVGASPQLKAVLAKVGKVAPTDSTVLITGETGTGKELIARAIHKRSKRSARAFVSVNCAAVPRDLIASELFGHEKGAFTGATQRRLGRFELAERGTIFLDEIGELPPETQIALLRVLQEREFERVGGTQPIRAEVRVIAATNRDLEAAIAAGTFRSDLFYRLNVFPIEIPALRDRRDDIPMLVEYFIDRYARKAGKSIRRINKRSLELLQAYPWPGNIRELQNIIERSVVVCETETLSIDESWLSRRPHTVNSKGQPGLEQNLAVHEKEMIEAALKDCGGRVFGPLGAAAKLGMPRSTLESRIRSLKIDKGRFKPVSV